MATDYIFYRRLLLRVYMRMEILECGLAMPMRELLMMGL